MDEIHRVREDEGSKSKGRSRGQSSESLTIGSKVEALRDKRGGKYLAGIVAGVLSGSDEYQIKFNDGTTTTLPLDRIRKKTQSAMQLKLMVFQKKELISLHQTIDMMSPGK